MRATNSGSFTVWRRFAITFTSYSGIRTGMGLVGWRYRIWGRSNEQLFPFTLFILLCPIFIVLSLVFKLLFLTSGLADHALLFFSLIVQLLQLGVGNGEGRGVGVGDGQRAFDCELFKIVDRIFNAL